MNLSDEPDRKCLGCGASLGTSVAGDQCHACLLALGVGLFGTGGDDDDESEFDDDVLPTFGDYQLLRQIARGGMGTVYRARQISLQRDVAVKIINGGQLASAESVERFRTEARAAARLDHPGVVPVYEVGEIDTQHYLCMKLIEGGSLAERNSRFRLNPNLNNTASRGSQRDIASIMLKITQAVTHTHELGVLHRDIKPGNILVDRNGNPMLTDFGIAKINEVDAGDLTRTRTVLGSPSYMAPEQADQDAGLVTTSVDVYGIGATLYTLLTGVPPFREPTLLATIRALADQSPRPLRQINPQIHPDLETIVMKCLRKDAADRYRNTAELGDELSRFIAGQPITARKISWVESGWRWCKRNPLVTTLTSIILSFGLVGLLTVLWQWQRAEGLNDQLLESLDRTRWDAIANMTSRDENARALAILASRLRNDPNDWRAAMLAKSLLYHRRFAQPKFSPVSHGDENEIRHATFNHRGDRFATASIDHTGRLWDSQTGEELCRFQHDDVVEKIIFAPDDSLVATASADGQVKIWSGDSGSLIHRIPHPAAINDLAFYGDDLLLVTACVDGSVRIWDLQTPTTDTSIRLRKTFTLSSPVKSLAVRQSGNRLVAGCFAGEVVVIDQNNSGDDPLDNPTWKIVRRYQAGPKLTWVGMSNDLRFVAASAKKVTCWNTDDDRVVFQGLRVTNYHPTFAKQNSYFCSHVKDSRTTQTIDLQSGVFLTDAITAKYGIFASDFSSDDRCLATGGWDYSINVWDLASSYPAVSQIRTAAAVQQLQFGPIPRQLLAVEGSTQIVTGTPPRDARVSVWNLGDSFPAPFWQPHGNRSCWSAHCKQTGTTAAVNDNFGPITLLDTELRELGTISHSLTSTVHGIAFTPDGKDLLLGSGRGNVECFDVESRSRRWGPVKLGATGQCYRLSHDGATLVYGAEDGIVRFIDVGTGKIKSMRLVHGGNLNDLNFSADDRLLATASDGHTAKIWKMESGELLQTFTHRSRVQAGKFSPDASRLVTGSNDFTARLWDIRQGTAIGRPMQHQGEISNASFSPDGNYVLTSARDGTARVWDARSGLPTVPPMLHSSAIREANFSPDGRLIITVDHEALQVWDAATGQPVGVRIRQVSFSGVGHDSMGGRVPFSPDGQFAVWGQTAPVVRKIDLSRPGGPAPDWYPSLLECVGGQRLSVDGGLRKIPVERILNMRQTPPSAFAKSDVYFQRQLQDWIGGSQPNGVNYASDIDPKTEPCTTP